MTDPENPDPILRRVRALIEARRYDEALFDLALVPESAEALNLTGLIALRRRTLPSRRAAPEPGSGARRTAF